MYTEKKGEMAYFTEHDGVRLYYSNLMRGPSISDIDVKPGVKTVEFQSSEEIMNSYDSVNVSLTKIEKVFPDVQEIIISSSIDSIFEIKNEMFPNVKRVISKNSQYLSGTMIRRVEKLKFFGMWQDDEPKEIELLNVFCRKNETLDLNGITYISEYAFSGCENLKFINCHNLIINEENAFSGYNPGYNAPVITAGEILIKINTTETAEIPCSVKYVKKNAIQSNIKKLIIHNMSHLQQITLSRHNFMIDTLCVNIIDKNKKDDFDFFDAKNILNNLNIKNIELSGENRKFCTVDGIIYSADKKNLLYCPMHRKGSVHILEGTEVIYNEAFAFTDIDSVVIPDSVKSIRDKAFYKSNIKNVILGNGLKEISSGFENGIFEDCLNLTEIEIPRNIKRIGHYAFCNSGLKKVIFHDGLEYIGNKAFQCEKLKTVELPKSLAYVGTKNFVFTEKIILHGKVINIIPSCTLMDSYHDNPIREFVLHGKSFYMPATVKSKYENNNNIAKLEYELEYHPDELFSAESCKLRYHIAYSMESKFELAVMNILNGFKDKEYCKIIQMYWKQISKRYIEKHMMQKLIYLFDTDILNHDELVEILDFAIEQQDITAASYTAKYIRNIQQRTILSL